MIKIFISCMCKCMKLKNMFRFLGIITRNLPTTICSIQCLHISYGLKRFIDGEVVINIILYKPFLLRPKFYL